MEILKKHEQFEMEVLELLSREGVLSKMIFGGGTCLRLCFGVNRYSVDLDFWAKNSFTKDNFATLKEILNKKYELTDCQSKHFSYLFEFRSVNYPRKLKIEIRKKLAPNIKTELNIAFSPYAHQQVRLTTCTLKQMWSNKLAALLERNEVRDAYDLEFIFKKGQALIFILTREQKEELIHKLQSFKPRDLKVKLGSLLNPEERRYYAKYGFKVLENGLR